MTIMNSDDLPWRGEMGEAKNKRLKDFEEGSRTLADALKTGFEAYRRAQDEDWDGCIPVDEAESAIDAILKQISPKFIIQ